MKKLAIMAILATSAIAASATDIGLRYNDNSNSITNSVGVVVDQKFGQFGAELAFDRSTDGLKNDRYSVLGTYDVVTIFGATVAAKTGVAYIRPSLGLDGYAAVVGAGVSYPLTKDLSAAVDYSYQRGQQRVGSYDGNTVSAGVKYSF